MKIVVDVVDSAGALVEQVEVDGTTVVANDAPPRRPETRGDWRHVASMRELAGRLGTSVARYLADRLTCR